MFNVSMRYWKGVRQEFRLSNIVFETGGQIKFKAILKVKFDHVNCMDLN